MSKKLEDSPVSGETNLASADFLSISLSSLKGEQPVPFDIYISVAGKFVLYMRKGEPLDVIRLERLRKRKLEQLYIVPQHAALFQDFLQNIEDPKAYEEAKTGTEKLIETLRNDDEALALMLRYPNIDQRLSVHGATVATLAVAMAKKMGIGDRAELRVLALGALLHDVGHLENGVSYKQPVSKMDIEMRGNYKKHPTQAALQSKFVPHFDPVVTRIILEHEELADGTGFPNKLKSKDVHPFSLIIGTANAYDRLVTFEAHKPEEALRKMIVDRGGKYSTESVNALKSVLAESKII